MYMKKWERIIGTVLVAFVVFWSFYLYYFDVESLNEKEEEPFTGVIRIWDYPRLNINTGSRYGWIQDKIKKFEKRNPGVYIEFTPIDWKTGPSKIEEGLRTGELPDIVPIGNDFSYIDKLEALDDYFTEDELDRFKSQAIRSVNYEGKMIGVPFMMTTYAVYLNIDLFNEKGVSPPVDGKWTYDEFVDTLKKLTYDSDYDGIIDKYGFVSFVEPNYYNLWGIILSDGAEIFSSRKNTYSFDSEKAISGVQKIVDLKYKYEVTPEFFGMVGESECWEMFYKDRKVAVYPTGSWAVNVLQKLLESGEGFNFDVAYYPIGDKKIPTALSNGVASFGVFKQEDAKKSKMCVKFLKYLTEDSNQKTLEDLGVFTIKRGITDMYINNPKMKRIEESLSYTYVVPKNELWKKIDDILQKEIREAIIGEKSSRKAVEDSKKQVEQLTK